MRTRRKRWRRIVGVGLLLVAGAACSVGVAWGAEAWRAYDDSKGRDTGYARRRTLADDISITMYVTTVVGRTEWRLHRFASPTVVTAEPPSWVELPAKQLGSITGASAYGLPFRCLKYSVEGSWHESDPSLPMTVGGSERYMGVIGWIRPQHRFFAWLPTQPLWLGLVGNTLIYAAAFGGVGWGSGAVRRARRRRRGCCVFCGYDLGGEFSRVCSECGKEAAA